MSLTVNEATGEVTAEIGGKTFRLHATFPRMADYQTAVGVAGFGALSLMLQKSDMRAIYHGLRCLCSSGNADDLSAMVAPKEITDAQAAIFKALAAGLPEATEAAEGNVGAPTSETT